MKVRSKSAHQEFMIIFTENNSLFPPTNIH